MEKVTELILSEMRYLFTFKRYEILGITSGSYLKLRFFTAAVLCFFKYVPLPIVIQIRNEKEERKKQNLIQLRNTKMLNILNYDGIGILDVKPTFYYICAYQNLDFSSWKFFHSFFKLSGV